MKWVIISSTTRDQTFYNPLSVFPGTILMLSFFLWKLYQVIKFNHGRITVGFDEGMKLRAEICIMYWAMLSLKLNQWQSIVILYLYSVPLISWILGCLELNQRSLLAAMVISCSSVYIFWPLSKYIWQTPTEMTIHKIYVSFDFWGSKTMNST
jgi:hypothetical protein